MVEIIFVLGSVFSGSVGVSDWIHLVAAGKGLRANGTVRELIR